MFVVDYLFKIKINIMKFSLSTTDSYPVIQKLSKPENFPSESLNDVGLFVPTTQILKMALEIWYATQEKKRENGQDDKLNG